MAGSPLAPLNPDQFSKLLSSQPGFTNQNLTIQLADDNSTIVNYTLDAFDNPLDSSSMTPSDWATIAIRLLQNYSDYDGFVVIHGTDTMAYTATALSFLLDGLTKPIVVTGSQIPLQQTRNDAHRNIVSSMVVAATSKIPESLLLFDAVVLRGNRSEKVNASEFPAFASPNFPPLASNGISILIDHQLVQDNPPASTSLDNNANRNKRITEIEQWKTGYDSFSVIILTLFPGLRASTVGALLEHTTPEAKGIVIEAFGAGNAPANPELNTILKNAHDNGTILIDTTQVIRGSVDLDAYKSASGLKLAGAVSGYDMTPEATLCKLIYLIGLGLDQKNIENQMVVNMHGEISLDTPD